jgi:hypothetical protein
MLICWFDQALAPPWAHDGLPPWAQTIHKHTNKYTNHTQHKHICIDLYIGSRGTRFHVFLRASKHLVKSVLCKGLRAPIIGVNSKCRVGRIRLGSAHVICLPSVSYVGPCNIVYSIVCYIKDYTIYIYVYIYIYIYINIPIKQHRF